MQIEIHAESTPEIEVNFVLRLFFHLLNIEIALPLPEFTDQLGIRIPVVGHLIFPLKKAVKKPVKLKFSRQKLLLLFKSYWNYLKLFDKTRNYLEHGTIIKRFFLSINPGISDPFYFGLTSGILYSISGSFYTLFALRVKKIENYHFQVNNDFKAPFAVKVDVLVEIPWTHLLKTTSYLLLLLIRQKIKGIFSQPLVHIKGEK